MESGSCCTLQAETTRHLLGSVQESPYRGEELRASYAQKPSLTSRFTVMVLLTANVTSATDAYLFKPGDIITIFSQRDISVPQTSRSQYVIVEGEVMRPGVYKLEKNETLRSVLQRAGGLSPNSYVYGAQLTRESARMR